MFIELLFDYIQLQLYTTYMLGDVYGSMIIFSLSPFCIKTIEYSRTILLGLIRFYSRKFYIIRHEHH